MRRTIEVSVDIHPDYASTGEVRPVEIGEYYHAGIGRVKQSLRLITSCHLILTKNPTTHDILLKSLKNGIMKDLESGELKLVEFVRGPTVTTIMTEAVENEKGEG